MNVAKLLDRTHYGLGIAARHVGGSADAYRPAGAHQPLLAENRFLRLHAAFLPVNKGNDSSAIAQWNGIFDASYTKPGDYLLQENRIFFIAGQQPLMPVSCVLTNRTISIVRPNLQTSTGPNPYGGYLSTDTSVLMTDWPASVLGTNGRGEPAAGLPTDQTIPYLVILMPSYPDVLIAPGDLVSDDIGRSAVVSGSELTELGWRLTAKLATN